MGYREIGRTGKKAARDLIEGFDFSNAGDYPTSIRSSAPSSSRCTIGSLRGTCSR